MAINYDDVISIGPAIEDGPLIARENFDIQATTARCARVCRFMRRYVQGFL